MMDSLWASAAQSAIFLRSRRFITAIEANVNRPSTISSNVCEPITRLANEVAYPSVSCGIPLEYRLSPKIMAHCHGPIPPFDGTRPVFRNHLRRCREAEECHVELTVIAAPYSRCQ